MPRKSRRAETPECVVLFHSTSAAMRAESVVKNAGLSTRLRPIPRHLSSDCGICLSFDPADRGLVESVLAENRVELDRFEML